MTLFMIVGASLAGGVLAMLLASTVLLTRPGMLVRGLPPLLSFSTGTLLGTALLGMVPEAAAALPVRSLGAVVLAGILLFFVTEKLLLWRHCHKEGCAVHASSGPLLLLGDSFHNFVDGIVIAGAFVSSIPLGLTTTFAVIAHEVPQEIGEFVVYQRSGFSRRRALLLNGATSLFAVPGAVLGYFFLSQARNARPYLLCYAAAGFIYIALADLIPAQRGTTGVRSTITDILLLGAGIGVIGLVAGRT